MTLTKNETVEGAENTHPDDPQQTGSGSAAAPGGAAAPTADMNDLTAGADSYPGDRPAGEDNPATTPQQTKSN